MPAHFFQGISLLKNRGARTGPSYKNLTTRALALPRHRPRPPTQHTGSQQPHTPRVSPSGNSPRLLGGRGTHTAKQPAAGSPPVRRRGTQHGAPPVSWRGKPLTSSTKSLARGNRHGARRPTDRPQHIYRPRRSRAHIRRANQRPTRSRAKLGGGGSCSGCSKTVRPQPGWGSRRKGYRPDQGGLEGPPPSPVPLQASSRAPHQRCARDREQQSARGHSLQSS